MWTWSANLSGGVWRVKEVLQTERDEERQHRSTSKAEENRGWPRTATPYGRPPVLGNHYGLLVSEMLGGPMVTRCHQIRRYTLGSVVGQNYCRSSASRTRHCERRFLAAENESFFDHQALVASVLAPFHPFPPGRINGNGYLKHGRNGNARKIVWN